MEKVEEIAGLGLIRTKDIIRDVDDVCGEAHRKNLKTDPTIVIGIDDAKVKTFIDTGAQISAMTRELYDKLKATGMKMSVIPIRKFILKRAFTEKRSLVAVKIHLELEVGGFKYVYEFC